MLSSYAFQCKIREFDSTARSSRVTRFTDCLPLLNGAVSEVTRSTLGRDEGPDKSAGHRF
jgi:hypothetical protein